MTLSLDDVRNKRFRMARKSGYEVLEVDEFVDEVEATFEQLFQENQNLKKQVEALRSGPAPAASAETTEAPTAAPAKEPQAAAQPAAAPAPSVPTERIVVSTSQDASSAVVRLVQLSTEQAEQLVAEATAEAARIRDEAGSSAQRVTSEAQQQADRLQAEARDRATALDRELETRRTAMFGDLEKQREQLSSTVAALRSFEATYRANLTQHLQSQIEVLAAGREEPANPPAVLSETAARTDDANTAAGQTPAGSSASAGAGVSDTPRLDALLGDQR